MADRVKTCGILWSVKVFFGLLEKRRPNKPCLWKVNLFLYFEIVWYCKNVNLSRKIAAKNSGCFLAYFFVADTKIVFGCDFLAPLIP